MASESDGFDEEKETVEANTRLERKSGQVSERSE
jgi:hypothetical protein